MNDTVLEAIETFDIRLILPEYMLLFQGTSIFSFGVYHSDLNSF